MLPQALQWTNKRQAVPEGVHSKLETLLNPRVILLLAPVLFWAHITEESLGGFMRWYNSVVSTPLPENGFITANLQPLEITVALALASAWIRRKEPAFLLLCWLSFYMFGNAIFHVTAIVALHRYCPGLITALALYLPYYFWYTRYLRTNLSMRASTVAIIGALATGLVYLRWHHELFRN